MKFIVTNVNYLEDMFDHLHKAQVRLRPSRTTCANQNTQVRLRPSRITCANQNTQVRLRPSRITCASQNTQVRLRPSRTTCANHYQWTTGIAFGPDTVRIN
jgi:hypothetical protein